MHKSNVITDVYGHAACLLGPHFSVNQVHVDPCAGKEGLINSSFSLEQNLSFEERTFRGCPPAYWLERFHFQLKNELP